MEKKKLILFDLDGTLVPTMQTYADVAARLLAARHAIAPERARALYLATSGLPFVKQIDLIVGQSPRNKETVRMFEAQKLVETKNVRIAESDRAALSSLRAKGYLLGITSNNQQENVNNFVRDEGLKNVFCRWLGWNDPGRLDRWVRRVKPSSKGEMHFRDFEKMLSVARADMLFVGDSLKDAEMAARAGVDFVPRVGTFAAHEFVAAWSVTSVAELNNRLP